MLYTAPGVGAVDSDLTLRVGTRPGFSGANPWQAVTALDYEILTLDYDLLVGYDEDRMFSAGFATSWTTSADGTTTTFDIRPGMTWSDGQSATAEDAAWTYELVRKARAEGVTLGSGYIDGYLAMAGLESASAPDLRTLVVKTESPTALLLPAYVPILPRHIWERYSVEQIGNPETGGFVANDPPIVGSGPYTAIGIDRAGSIRFARNPHYWGRPGAAEEVVLTPFQDGGSMVRALRTGEIDYARGIEPDAFDSLDDEPDIVTVEGFGNDYSYLAFNGYPRSIQGGGTSTRAVADPAFRDALAWAIDSEELINQVLGGYGTPGTSLLTPFQAPWYVPPEADVQRRFDLTRADERLTAAGYTTDAAGNRLDRDGRPIRLRMTWPASEGEYALVAQRIGTWWAELGIAVDAGATDDATLLARLTPPDYEPPGRADFDTYLWRWIGDIDPTTLLQPFTSDEIGASSDTFWSNPRFDELFDLQGRTLDQAERRAILREMQQIFYREVPNIPLYSPSELHAYRTDRFIGWQNQPPQGGTPLFGFGPIGYTRLTAADPGPDPSSSNATVPSPTASATKDGTGSPSGGTTTSTGPLLVVACLVTAAIIGVVAIRRRPIAPADEG